MDKLLCEEIFLKSSKEVLSEEYMELFERVMDYQQKLKNVLDKLSEKHREGRQQESKLSKEIDVLFVQLENENLSDEDRFNIQEQFRFETKKIAELRQYNKGLHDAKEIIVNNINCKLI